MRGGLRIRGDEVGENAKPLKMGKKDIALGRKGEIDVYRQEGVQAGSQND